MPEKRDLGQPNPSPRGRGQTELGRPLSTWVEASRHIAHAGDRTGRPRSASERPSTSTPCCLRAANRLMAWLGTSVLL